MIDLVSFLEIIYSAGIDYLFMPANTAWYFCFLLFIFINIGNYGLVQLFSITITKTTLSNLSFIVLNIGHLVFCYDWFLQSPVLYQILGFVQVILSRYKKVVLPSCRWHGSLSLLFRQSTIMVIIVWEFLMFYQIFSHHK